MTDHAVWVPPRRPGRRLKRHCERSEAIHRATQEVRVDCFAALAMTSEYGFAFSRRGASKACIYFPPREGVGNAGRPMHPQSGGQKRVDSRTSVVTTGLPETPSIPAHNGFNRLLRALPGDRALLPPSPDGYSWSAPGWADFASERLDTSVEVSGPHDFTVRFSTLRPHAR
jgi:hypothetical protein